MHQCSLFASISGFNQAVTLSRFPSVQGSWNDSA